MSSAKFRVEVSKLGRIFEGGPDEVQNAAFPRDLVHADALVDFIILTDGESILVVESPDRGLQSFVCSLLFSAWMQRG